eukprot:TRINITY_DN858_c0_g1_i11.p1 TRINITY_DN858_c0_g1~~TRINITY_DN858_c0_g1_i11.p1  ORF type:complete len:163 (-),score=17.11 TRINITY_DN858_c0_g1_i11:78-566(-)
MVRNCRSRGKHNGLGHRKHLGAAYKKRDFDQIVEDLGGEKPCPFLNQPRDPDQIGEGQFYCVPCARYFVNQEALRAHYDGSLHKRSLRRLKKEKPWTEDDARGMGTDTPRRHSTATTSAAASAAALLSAPLADVGDYVDAPASKTAAATKKKPTSTATQAST